ncbi:hypothetical protein MCOR19_008017 [Pyricularia oryzae]|nr:hypothetical protein MCOR19_008017 [Pyricularia oryzae]KAI6291172.1 hypothetical protein MCOR34_010258 [Pyricularia oryzae]KAI6471693.1 hypothetical protein MCOR15_000827 [Pyricularia oryzae]KAI6481659.1 hypothetical protein MCOR13_010757 [Pyricularia oryzae]KAI6537265.1 hypothetical protein MCOR10_001702 [Pyricularia oryzae]
MIGLLRAGDIGAFRGCSMSIPVRRQIVGGNIITMITDGNQVPPNRSRMIESYTTCCAAHDWVQSADRTPAECDQAAVMVRFCDGCDGWVNSFPSHGIDNRQKGQVGGDQDNLLEMHDRQSSMTNLNGLDK